MTHKAPSPDTTTLTDASDISEKIRKHELLQQRLRDETASLGGEYPGQWAGMGPDQVLMFSDTLEEIVHKLNPGKDGNHTVVVKYLSSEPPVLIL